MLIIKEIGDRIQALLSIEKICIFQKKICYGGFTSGAIGHCRHIIFFNNISS